MKRSITIVMLLIYFVFSAGVMVNFHFCGGRLGQITFFKELKSCCPDANLDGSCCQNSSAYYRIQSGYQNEVLVGDVSFAKPIAIHHTEKTFENCLFTWNGWSRTALSDHSLSLTGKQPRYLSHRVLII